MQTDNPTDRQSDTETIKSDRQADEETDSQRYRYKEKDLRS